MREEVARSHRLGMGKCGSVERINPLKSPDILCSSLPVQRLEQLVGNSLLGECRSAKKSERSPKGYAGNNFSNHVHYVLTTEGAEVGSFAFNQPALGTACLPIRFWKVSEMENKNSPMLPKLAFVWGFAGAAAMLLLALGAFLISSQFRSGPDSRALLGEIQRIGELRTASRTVKNVVQVESALDPPQPLNMIPGARQISHALTKNEAALEYTATIEAGVDLQHASIRRAVRDGNQSWIVSLPPAVA